MNIYIVHEPIDAVFSSPGEVVSVHSTREGAARIVALPCGYVNGDRQRPVSSGRWIAEYEVQP